jgi:hypothetical protein
MAAEVLDEDLEEAVQLEEGKAGLAAREASSEHLVNRGSGTVWAQNNTIGTGPALVFFCATLRLSSGPYSSACSKYSS